MKIKILGGGCIKCKKLYDNVKSAVDELGIEAEFEKITDYKDIARFNVMSTPALVVDGRVIVAGRVPNAKWIQNNIVKQ